MRAADLVKRIWGAPPPATTATTATQCRPRPDLSQLSQLSQGGKQGNSRLAVASVASVASGQATQKPPANDASSGIAPRLADLLKEHGGYPGVRWHELALIDTEQSDLWIVQRPDGLLTVLATVEPIGRPQSYPQAWPARWRRPKPPDATDATSVQAKALIERVRWCWDCRSLSTLPRPGNRTPQCQAGHPLLWRIVNPGHRTMPGRTDARNCPDRKTDEDGK